MDINSFKKILDKRNVFKFEKNTCSVNFAVTRRLKKFFKHIDFQCNINPKNGECKEYKNKNNSGLRCCCFDCLTSVGYFHIMANSEISFYAKKFSSKTGFWREGKGCILPHERRSIVCLTHHCNHSDEGFEEGIIAIGSKLRSIRKEIVDVNREKSCK